LYFLSPLFYSFKNENEEGRKGTARYVLMDVLMDALMDVLREKDDEMRRRRKKGTIDQIDLFIGLGTIKLMPLTLFHNRSRYLGCFLPV
jgi:hypothetical protein